MSIHWPPKYLCRDYVKAKVYLFGHMDLRDSKAQGREHAMVDWDCRNTRPAFLS